VKGVSIVIRRSLRDLLHQIPSTEAAIKVKHRMIIGLIFQEFIVVSFVIFRKLQVHMRTHFICTFVSNVVLLQIEELKAALSSWEYQIITECALSNISETPHVVPPLKLDSQTSSVDAVEPIIAQDTVGVESDTANGETWIVMKVSVTINLVEMSLYRGSTRDASLSTMQVLFFSFSIFG
jgi:vacuolar protein sorting-associated protein 13A/C